VRLPTIPTSPKATHGDRTKADQFHHQRALFLAVDGGDVRVVERGQDLCLALEARHAVRIVREGLGQDFDGHLAPELVIVARQTSPMPLSPSLAVMR
jgi:hypothetical protein